MPSAAELRELDDDELETRLAEYRRDLLNLRFQLATGQLDNSARLGEARRDVARVLTVLRDREIALVEGRPALPVEPLVRRPSRAARRAAEVEEAEPEPEVGEDVAELEGDAETDVAVGEGTEDLDHAEEQELEEKLETEVLTAEDDARSLGSLPVEGEEAEGPGEPAPAAKGRRLSRTRRRRGRDEEEVQ